MAHMKYDEIRIYPNHSSLDLHVPHLPGAFLLCPVSKKTGPGGLGMAGAAAEKVVVSRFAELPGRSVGSVGIRETLWL